jgi:M6 family metalloprotease-like protein/uncharacterized repeat protein (TIGR01451 family)
MRRIALCTFTFILIITAMAGASWSSSAQQQGEEVELIGYFNILWPHVMPGYEHIDPEPEFILDVPNDDIDQFESYTLSGVQELAAARGGVHRLNHDQVRVAGILDPETNRIELEELDFAIIIESAGDSHPAGGSHVFSSHVHGEQAWLNVLCRFGDSTGSPPAEAEFFDDLTDYMDTYWREVSYHEINLTGSETAGWYDLPRDRVEYLTGGSHFEGHELNHSRIALDCSRQAILDDINLMPYDGLNLMFDGPLDCCAWGGSRVLPTNIGLTTTFKRFAITYMPIGGWQSQAVLAHEMAHGFGLPHSSGPFQTGTTVANTYDSNWDVLSGKGKCNNPHPDFGCIGVHTVAAHKDALGWIPDERIYVPNDSMDQLVFLERLADPFQLFGYDMIKLPIVGTNDEYYTVEARMQHGFDSEIPGNAVIIHRMDRTLDDRNAQVYVRPGGFDTNGPEAQWRPGDIFEIDELDYTIAIINEQIDAGGFDVVINPTPADLSVSLATDPDVAISGDELTYIATIANHGPYDAENVVLTQILPEEVTYIEDDHDCAISGDEVTCDIGDINVDQSVTVEIVVSVPENMWANQQFVIESSAEVFENHETAVDPDWSNNTDELRTQTSSVADIEAVSLTAIDPPINMLVDDVIDVELELTLVNNGPSMPAVADLEYEITTDPGLSIEFLNFPGDGGYWGISDEPRTFTQNHRVTCEAAGRHQATIVMELEPRHGSDPDPENNSASETLTVDCLAPIQIDIQGGTVDTPINLHGNGVVPLQLSISDDEDDMFDLSTIDISTVIFGRHDNLFLTDQPTGAKVERGQGRANNPHGPSHPHGRGNAPLLLHFNVQDALLEPDDTEACLIGEAELDGETITFFGCDDIMIRP